MPFTPYTSSSSAETVRARAAIGGEFVRVVTTWRDKCALYGLLLTLFVPIPAIAQTTFTRVDAQSGIDVVNATFGPTWGDFNADGYDDVFVGNHLIPPPNLFRGGASGFFVDIYESSGMDYYADRHGAAWGDMDNDGLRELYVTVGAEEGQGVGHNELYLNLDGHNFENISVDAGASDSTGRGRCVCWVDVDNDGWLDLFVGNMATPNKLYMNNGDGTFTDNQGSPGILADGLWYPAFTDIDNDRDMDLLMVGDWTGEMGLFRNEGEGVFVDITEQSNLQTENMWCAQGICWLDYDNDGDQDFYISRGGTTGIRDALQVRTDEVLFYSCMSGDPDDENGLDGLAISATDGAMEFDLRIDFSWAPSLTFLGSDGQHPDNMPFTAVDGQYLGRPDFTAGEDLGVYIWQEHRQGSWYVQCSTDFSGFHKMGGIVRSRFGTISDVDATGIEVPEITVSVSDRLYRNRGDGTFEDVSYQAGIGDQQSGHTCFAVDFDNDGWEDIYVLNERNMEGYLTSNQPNFLYLNNGDGTFREAAQEAGVACEVDGTGAGAAWSDYDNDGFPDLYVTNGFGYFPFREGPQVLYHNEGNSNHWVKIRLVGQAQSNRDGIGTRVRAVAGGMAQVRVQTGGVADISQNTMDVHFGLGTAAVIDTLELYWPGGQTDRYINMAADEIYTLYEPDLGEVGEVDADHARYPLELTAPGLISGRTHLSLELAQAGQVHIDLVDATGRLVTTIFEGRKPAGQSEITWSPAALKECDSSSGVYFLRAQSGRHTVAQRVVFVQ